MKESNFKNSNTTLLQIRPWSLLRKCIFMCGVQSKKSGNKIWQQAPLRCHINHINVVTTKMNFSSRKYTNFYAKKKNQPSGGVEWPAHARFPRWCTLCRGGRRQTRCAQSALFRECARRWIRGFSPLCASVLKKKKRVKINNTVRSTLWPGLGVNSDVK